MKNIQTIIKLTARNLNIKEDVVESVTNFFWKEVRRKASSLESTSITIKHLGTITTSKRKIDYFIKTTIAKIRAIKKSNRYKETTKELLLETNYERLKKALVQRNILAKQYYDAYIKRSERVFTTSTSDFQECGQDSGSNNQSGKDGITSIT